MRVLLLLAFGLFAHLSLAQDLQPKEVEKWLSSIGPIQSWLDQQASKIPASEPPADNLDMEKMMQYSIQALKKAGLFAEFEQKIKAAGYQDVEQWARISQRISLAFMAIQQEEAPLSREQILAQIEQLKGLDLPAENKQAMEKMLQGSLAMLGTIEAVNAQDKAAVRPHLKQLLTQFGAEANY